MAKKILIFSTAYFPLVGGAEVAVKEITDRIGNIQFDMITLRFSRQHPKQEKIGNINVYRISGTKFLFPIRAFFKAVKLNKKNHYNLIWSIMASYGGFGALFFKTIYPKVLFLLTLQEGDSEKHILSRVSIFYPVWKKIFQKADYIQAISAYLADFAKRHGARCQIEIVPNGVDINKFRNPKSEIRNKSKILITTSRLVKKNAVDDIIKAMKYLPENIKLFIIGDGPLKNNYALLITRYGLQERVKFFGYIPHEEIVKYLHNADIFIRPSLSEGMGNSFIEAMAAGVPVIATPVGGIPDFLKDGETGLFCNVRDPKSIAEKVKIYLENNELREKIIRNAKEMVEKNYDWNLIASKMNNIFNKLTTCLPAGRL